MSTLDTTAKGSKFESVLKRRKSRQSTYSYANVDFDYSGNAAQYEHLLRKRSDKGSPRKEQLSFEMNLRCYRNETDFRPDHEWAYPAPK